MPSQTPVRIAILKKVSVGEDVEKQNPCTVGRNVN